MINVTNEKIAGPLKIILRFKSSPPEAANDTEVPKVAKFKDIPIPDGSVMDMNNTVIFGSDDEWFGKLSLIPNLSHAETFDFFRYEMPNLNWKEITNVRSTSSVLSYEKENRVVTIQITKSYGKTLCSVNMSPKKQ